MKSNDRPETKTRSCRKIKKIYSVTKGVKCESRREKHAFPQSDMHTLQAIILENPATFGKYVIQHLQTRKLSA